MISDILDNIDVVVNEGQVVVDGRHVVVDGGNVVVHGGLVVVDGGHVGEGGCQLEEHVRSEALSHRHRHHPFQQLFSSV